MAKTNKTDLVLVGIRIPRGVNNRLKEIAKVEDRTFIRVVRRALIDFIYEWEKTQAHIKQIENLSKN